MTNPAQGLSLVREARDALLELTRQMQTGIWNHPEVEGLMQQLSQALETVTGKKSYGYLPKSIKKFVDEIVDQMERLPVVSDCYDRWLELQGQVGSYYGGDKRKRLPLSQQKEFRAIKNAVIQEAERIRLGEITFEDAGMEQRDEEDDLLADPRRRSGQRVRTVLSRSRGQSAPAIRHAGGNPTAPPHEPHFPGQLSAQDRPRGDAD